MENQSTGCPPPTQEELRERWVQWTQAMELSHGMLMAGLQAQVGPDGDVHAAYRRWYDQYQSVKWKDAATKIEEVAKEPLARIDDAS